MALDQKQDQLNRSTTIILMGALGLVLASLDSALIATALLVNSSSLNQIMLGSDLPISLLRLPGCRCGVR